MTQTHCIITGEELTAAKASKAHVMPSALGWRFKPTGIMCKKGNTLIGDEIDLPLITCFQPIATMLDVSRDRGKNQPIKMTDEGGRAVLFSFAEPLQILKPGYDSSTDADGVRRVKIEARTMKELRQLLGRAAKEFPNLDVDEALAHAVKAQEWPEGMLTSQLQVGPRYVWPALFVGASIFAASQGCDTHPELKRYVERFDADNPELPPDTFYFVPPEPIVPKGDVISHAVVLVADAERRSCLVYLEIFNTAGVGVVLPYQGSANMSASEAVNVLTGERLVIDVQDERIRSLDWSVTHKLGEQSFMDIQREAITRASPPIADLPPFVGRFRSGPEAPLATNLHDAMHQVAIGPTAAVASYDANLMGLGRRALELVHGWPRALGCRSLRSARTIGRSHV